MAADGIGAPTDPSRWRDAQEWFQKRRPVIRNGATQTVRDAQARAFRVAGITSVNLVTEVHQAIDDAIANGTTLDEFKKRVGAKLAEEWGAPNARRVETIFRTNVQSAYNAGRYAEMTRPAVLAVRPFWKYVAILDGRTTTTCAPLNGVIAKHDDAFWESHFPPLHFNCRSTVVSLSRGETERAGGAKKPPEAKPPGEGFGTRPDLAGANFEPGPAASPTAVRALKTRNEQGRITRRPEAEVLDETTATEVMGDVLGEERAARWLKSRGVEVYFQENLIETIDRAPDGSETTEYVVGTYRNRAIYISTRTGEYRGFFNPGDKFVDEGAATARDAFGRILWHEFAHAVHANTSDELKAAITSVWRQSVRAGAFVSRYARDNDLEWWAEVFAAYRYEPDALAEVDPDGSIRALVRRILKAEDLE
jgi:SPP1 gp7 family putative phage head morphogenesis protein